MMVSISGVGFLIGSLINNLFVERLNIHQLISFGSIVYVLGYLTLSTSFHLIPAAIGFFTISFALAFIQTGFRTFIQWVFPTEKVGQLTTAFNSLNALIEMSIVATVSGLASIFNIRLVLISTELLMIVIVFLIIFYSKKLQVARI